MNRMTSYSFMNEHDIEERYELVQGGVLITSYYDHVLYYIYGFYVEATFSRVKVDPIKVEYIGDNYYKNPRFDKYINIISNVR